MSNVSIGKSTIASVNELMKGVNKGGVFVVQAVNAQTEQVQQIAYVVRCAGTESPGQAAEPMLVLKLDEATGELKPVGMRKRFVTTKREVRGLMYAAVKFLHGDKFIPVMRKEFWPERVPGSN